MPVHKQGNMWSVFDGVDYFLITTNSTIKKDGSLVMGAGIAKEVKDRFPGIEYKAGKAVNSLCGSEGIYGLILSSKIGLFQTKRHFKDNAILHIIETSSKMLEVHARSHPEYRYALNFPGIGLGRRKYEDVLPLINNLPDNVEIWTYID